MTTSRWSKFAKQHATKIAAIEREDRVTTGKGGGADISLGEDTSVYVAENSGILIRQLHSSGANDGGLKGIVTVEKGMVRMESRAGARPMHLRIEQETLKVDIKKSASFMVNHNDGTDIVCLMSGEVQVQARKDRRKLKSPNTCFLYNAETKASSLRNMEDNQVKAVIALTTVKSSASAPRKPVGTASTASPAATTLPAPTPAAVTKAPVVKAPAAIAKAPVATAPAPVATAPAAVAPAATAPAPTAPTKTAPEVANNNLISMMRRPAPEGVPEVTAPTRSAPAPVSRPTPAPTPVTPSSRPTPAPVSSPAPTSSPQPARVATTAPAAVAPTRAPVATLAPRQAPIATAPSKQPTSVATRNPSPAPITRPKPKPPVATPRSIAKKKYATPSGRLEQWTIDLGIYDQSHYAADLLEELRGLGYFPTLTSTTVRGKEVYNLSIQGMPSRVASERAANEIVSKTSASSFWLRNFYLTP